MSAKPSVSQPETHDDLALDRDQLNLITDRSPLSHHGLFEKLPFWES